jgi:hypothetical protein
MIPQQNIDLVALVGGELKKRSGQMVGACPFCGGVDRFYIDLKRNAWGCRHCQTGYNDAIAFVARRENLDLSRREDMQKAKELIGVVGDPTPTPSKPRETTRAVSELADYDAFDIDFQIPAYKFVRTSHLNLWDYPKRMSYLTNERRLEMSVIKDAMIGFNPHAITKTFHEQVYLPHGIVIPWFNRDQVWRIRFRTDNPVDRYKQVAGGANALYVVDSIKPSSVVVLCEGEFDALSVASDMERWKRRTGWLHPVTAVATGGVTQARVLRYVGLLSVAKKVLVAYDSDAAGETASQFWLDVLPNAVRALPTKHDLNDMVIANVNIARWVQGHLK